MSKLVILELEGDFQQSGFRATLEMRLEETSPLLKVKGFLPPAPDLAAQLNDHWQQHYSALGLAPQRIKGQKIIHKGSINRRIAECRESAQRVCDRFCAWLSSESFQAIDRRLREELQREEVIRFLLHTDNPQLQKLPWHEWDFFQRYTNAEIAFSSPEYERAISSIPGHESARVRILAILGNSQGIDVDTDRRKLAALPHAEVEFLVEPDRRQLSDRLWEQRWDILFFAGHSETHNDAGRIYINQTDSLSLSELKYGLKKAIAQGLQLAIFNSCDGLGLADELRQLQLPYLIVMREPVIDQVAHAFLQYFLDAFANGLSLYLATRQARERLQGLEHQFPCASWLPVICQASTTVPPTWQDLCHQSVNQLHASDEVTTAQLLPQHQTRIKFGWQFVRTGLLISTFVMLAVMGVRGLRLLEPLEFAAFDQLLRLRPSEGTDPRLLVVAVTKQDIEQLGNEYPISDRTLLTALQALEVHQPRVIGIDIYRDRATGAGWTELMSYLQQRTAASERKVITICVHSSESQPDSGVAPPPNLSVNSLGFADAVIDSDGVVRRHLLALDPPNQSPCTAPYALSTKLALRYLESQGIALEFPSRDQWQLGSTRFQVLAAPAGLYQRRSITRGHQILLNYRTYNSLSDIAEQVTLTDVLTNRVDPALIRDKIVLMGVTDPTVEDYAKTPYGDEMRGLLFHVQMVSQLVSAVEDQRPLLRFWSFGAELGWVWVWSAAGYVAIASTMGLTRRWLTGSLLILTLCGISVLLMVENGVIVALIPSLLACLLSGGLVWILERDRRSHR